MLTYKIYPRPNQTDKSGLSAMYCLVICNRVVSRFSLNLKVDLKHFDEVKNKAKSGMTNYLFVNSHISKYEKLASDITLEYSLHDKPLSYKVFKDRVLGEEKADGGADFYAFIKERVNQSNFAYNTQRNYTTLYNALKEFKPKLSFEDLTYNFIIGFRQFLIKKGNIENGYNKKLNMIKALMHEAERQGMTVGDPFKDIKLRETNPHRVFLELHEIERLQELFEKGTLNPQDQNVLRYFLFSCFTGLRFSDVEHFSTDMIQNEKISIVSVKTKETMVIPLLPQARALLPEESKQFRVISNQKTNDALKRIMEIAKIHKNVSSHTARHSFATISHFSGIRLEVISKILGHANLKTTMIYAKILDEVKVEEMKLWGKKKSK